MMKKISFLVLVFSLNFTLTGCSLSGNQSVNLNNNVLTQPEVNSNLNSNVSPGKTIITSPYVDTNIKSILAVYSGRWFGPCGSWSISYSKENDQYKRKSFCNGATEPDLKETVISKEEFESHVFINAYLSKVGISNFKKLGKTELIANSQKETNDCWQSQDGVDLICANKEGVIIDLFSDFTKKGITDGNERYKLEKFETK